MSNIGSTACNLTILNNYPYTIPVAAKSAAGIGVPIRARAQWRSSEALFLCPQFMAGVMGATSVAPVLLPGNANPVTPATLLIGVNGGGSLTQQEATAMKNPTQNPSGFNADHLDTVREQGSVAVNLTSTEVNLTPLEPASVDLSLRSTAVNLTAVDHSVDINLISVEPSATDLTEDSVGVKLTPTDTSLVSTEREPSLLSIPGLSVSCLASAFLYLHVALDSAIDSVNERLIDNSDLPNVMAHHIDEVRAVLQLTPYCYLSKQLKALLWCLGRQADLMPEGELDKKAMLTNLHRVQMNVWRWEAKTQQSAVVGEAA
ncbi:hypothetical protein [Spongiibacter tropicus]|uniref:hypothetical protein n=1 Tax=Spongiibacter tropicus TaxID=454602 RepID=UPI0012F8C0A5|nr:hypothetical protein [Spongiibacter tropicus]